MTTPALFDLAEPTASRDTLTLAGQGRLTPDMITPPEEPFDYSSLTCPLDGCGEDLHLEWRLSRPLFEGDLNAPEAISSIDAYVATWRVTCTDGHVILLPGPAACPCGADECSHADFDTSDEFRSFRAHDVERLRRTLDQLAAKVEATR